MELDAALAPAIKNAPPSRKPCAKTPAPVDRRMFAVCWVAFLVASLVVGALLLSLYRQSTTEKVRHASAAVAHGCDAIAARYQTFAPNRAATQLDLRRSSVKTQLIAVVQAALRGSDGVEGGIWQSGAGSLAYAFPTYEGRKNRRSARGTGEPPGSGGVRQSRQCAVRPPH
jgi:hypothetical protein